jgi:hypothetical protein
MSNPEVADDDVLLDRTVFWYSIVESVTRVVIMALKCATVVGCFYCAYLAIASLAGRATDAQISLVVGYFSDQGDGKVVAVSLLVGALGVLYGIGQRLLRIRTIRDFAEYRKAVEGPTRTSSMLDSSGATNPIDR